MAIPLPFLSDADQRAVAEIAQVVVHSRGRGCIYFAVCNNRLKRESVETELRASLRVPGIGVSRVILAERVAASEEVSYRILVEDPVAFFADRVAVAPTFFLIHGLPELIYSQRGLREGDDDSRVAPVVQRLNYGREVFRRNAISCLFWLDPETLAYLMARARDFWSFRSGTARFEEASSDAGDSMEVGRERETPKSRGIDSLHEKMEQLAVYRAKSPPDEHAVADLLLDIGRIRINKYDLQAALAALHEGEALFERLGDQQRLCRVKSELSRAYERLGRHEKAEEYSRNAIALAEATGDEPGLAVEYNNLGLIYQGRGELEHAEALLRKAITIDERRGDQHSLAIRYNNLSQIYEARGEGDEAENWLRKAIAIDESTGHELSLAIRYNNLSQIYYDRGELEPAEAWLRKSIVIAERLGDESNLAIGYNNLSQIYQTRGELQQAEIWLRKAIAIDERLGDEPGLAVRYNNLSQIFDALGQLEPAEMWLRKAIAIDERLGDEPNLAIDYSNLGQIYKARGDLVQAEAWLRKALALAEKRGSAKTLATTRGNLKALQDQLAGKDRMG